MYDSVLETVLFKDITIRDAHYITSKFVERFFPKGQIVFFQGDEGNELYIVKSGAVKIYRQDDSREIILAHQFPGETIGELEVFHYDNERLASVAAIEPTTLWMIKKRELEQIVQQYPEVLRQAFYTVSERLAQANRKIEYLAFLDTRVRVANLLLDLHSNFGKETADGIIIDWKITQQHFASMIGVGRESAARVLLEFQSEGAIKIQHKQIYICNFTVIQTIAGQYPSSNEGRKSHPI